MNSVRSGDEDRAARRDPGDRIIWHKMPSMQQRPLGTSTVVASINGLSRCIRSARQALLPLIHMCRFVSSLGLIRNLVEVQILSHLDVVAGRRAISSDHQ